MGRDAPTGAGRETRGWRRRRRQPEADAKDGLVATAEDGGGGQETRGGEEWGDEEVDGGGEQSRRGVGAEEAERATTSGDKASPSRPSVFHPHQARPALTHWLVNWLVDYSELPASSRALVRSSRPSMPLEHARRGADETRHGAGVG